MSGKGSKRRIGEDKKKFDEGWDEIDWSKKKRTEPNKEKTCPKKQK